MAQGVLSVEWASLGLEHGLRCRRDARGKARHGDGCLGHHRKSGRRVHGRVTCGKSWVVGQNDSHDWSRVWVDARGWRHGLQVVKVLCVLQILNRLHLDRLHAWQALSGLHNVEVVAELGLVMRL